MSDEDALLQGIIENPDADGPRLVYADWLEEQGQEERAEFIRVQCTLARMLPDDPRRDESQAREKALLTAYREVWGAPLRGLVRDWTFRRGFVEEVEVSDEQFMSKAAAVFHLTPLRHAEVASWEDSRDTLPLLAVSPQLRRLRTIGLSFGCYEVGEAAFHRLAGMPHMLGRLASVFAVECHIGARAAASVFRSPHLLQLSNVYLSDCDLLGADGARAFAGPHLSCLTRLSLHKNYLGDAGVAVLLESPVASQLTALDLTCCEVGDAGAKALADSPQLSRLTELCLDDNEIGDEGAQALAESQHLVRLAYLRVSRNRIGDLGAAALASSRHVARLRHLWLRGNSIGPATEQRLRACFGGVVELGQ
jgi:uncharacterized protein (TIGR02996 family)